MRIRDVALDTPHDDRAAQRSAPADLYGVAEPVGARRLPDQTPVDALATLAQNLDDTANTVH